MTNEQPKGVRSVFYTVTPRTGLPPYVNTAQPMSARLACADAALLEVSGPGGGRFRFQEDIQRGEERFSIFRTEGGGRAIAIGADTWARLQEAAGFLPAAEPATEAEADPILVVMGVLTHKVAPLLVEAHNRLEAHGIGKEELSRPDALRLAHNAGEVLREMLEALHGGPLPGLIRPPE